MWIPTVSGFNSSIRKKSVINSLLLLIWIRFHHLVDYGIYLRDKLLDPSINGLVHTCWLQCDKKVFGRANSKIESKRLRREMAMRGMVVDCFVDSQGDDIVVETS
eukprot:167136-Pyramimonas_sp.AAC.1